MPGAWAPRIWRYQRTNMVIDCARFRDAASCEVGENIGFRRTLAGEWWRREIKFLR